MKFYFKRPAKKELDKLDPDIRRRILEKMQEYAEREDSLAAAEKLKDRSLGEF